MGELWLGEGPSIIEHSKEDHLKGWIATQWARPILAGEKTSPWVNETRTRKLYPTPGEDWSYTPKEVWNPNSGAYYPKYFIELSYKIQWEKFKNG